MRGVDGREYVYDAEDRLVAAGNATFAYDVDSFLTRKTVGGAETRYAYGAGANFCAWTCRAAT